MGGSQNYGPLFGPLCTRCRIVLKTQKGTIILTTTHMVLELHSIPEKQERDKASVDPPPFLAARHQASKLNLKLHVASGTVDGKKPCVT